MRTVLGCLLLVGCTASAADEGVTESDVTVTDGPAYSLSLTESARAEVDEAFLRREIEAAIDLYARDVAVPTRPIDVVVDAPDCLRTGYDMKDRKVRFCNNDDTPRMGTASADVIHHELFHALLCQTKPAWCDLTAPASAERTALHEGLADYFSYQLAPDDAFGEGFYRDRPSVRRYRVPYCYSLVASNHERGNAISSALIVGHPSSSAGLSPVKRLVLGDDLTLDALFGATPDDLCFSAAAPKIERTAVGYPESTLERYRIRAGAPLTLSFAGDAAFTRRYSNLAIRWEPAPTLFAITPSGTSEEPRSFSVAATGKDGFEKIVALYVVDGEVVGGKPFYFQVADPLP